MKSLLLTGLAASCVLGMNAATINFNDFSNVSGLQINGNASQQGNTLQLTPPNFNQSGSAFSTTTVPLQNQSSFSTRFQFQITTSGGAVDTDFGAGADGLVFVVQTVANNVGGGGGGIGYAGINNSVGIEFDTWDNGAQDAFLENHVGVNLNGSVTSSAILPVVPDFNDGNIWTAWVDYDGLTDTLEVRFNQSGARPAAASLAYVTDLTTVLGVPNAFVGFTSGTGAAFGDHRILNWVFESDFNPVGSVPEGGSSWALLGLGVAALVFSCAREKKMALARR